MTEHELRASVFNRFGEECLFCGWNTDADALVSIVVDTCLEPVNRVTIFRFARRVGKALKAPDTLRHESSQMAKNTTLPWTTTFQRDSRKSRKRGHSTFLAHVIAPNVGRKQPLDPPTQPTTSLGLSGSRQTSIKRRTSPFSRARLTFQNLGSLRASRFQVFGNICSATCLG